MERSDAARAIHAAVAIAASLSLRVDDTIVLFDSNKLTLRLLPDDVVARVAPAGQECLQLEVDVARQLGAAGCPVAALEPRVAPRVYERDGFRVTFWQHYESVVPPRSRPPVAYATALAQLHTGLRTLDVAVPHFTDRVAEAQHLVATREQTPALAEPDREMLDDVLRGRRRAIAGQGAEQPLHGEPHPGNLVGPDGRPRFVDFESVCRGPIEFDLAHVPSAVSAAYTGANSQLVDECRLLVLAMVAAWRYDTDDRLPDGPRKGKQLLRALRAGPPWPNLDGLTDEAGDEP